jgi:hypothetical protein
MEEGSLLQEALAYMENVRNGQIDGGAQDLLQIDVHDSHPLSDRISQFQRLSQRAAEFNNDIAQCDYQWHVGYPPVFGIHVTDGLPHLRATCRYGDNVGDEWMVIRCMMELSKKFPTMAIDCWDLDVGPILLIEGSEGLPDWLSEGNVDDSRFICWIINGNITLIGPTISDPSLHEALESLRNDESLSTPPKLQAELEKTIMNDSIRRCHRTALVVPRPVARLLQQSPELANAAAVAYAKSPSLAVMQQHEDWVFTTCSLARTNYAMLRTVPPQDTPKLTPELKRIQRTCSNEATPHLHFALDIGMHLTAGFDRLLKQKSETVDEGVGISRMERRILQYWTGIDVACGGDGSWLQQAWEMGPTKSPYDITYIMKCPVFQHESMFPFPVSQPGVSMQQVIQSKLKRKESKDELFEVPRPEDVDDEVWIHRGEEALEEAMAKRGPTEMTTNSFSMEEPQEQQLDEMIGGFQQFMSGESELEGVAHKEKKKRNRPSIDEPIVINPIVFLNTLHDVLKSSPEDLARNLNGIADDPFFSEEDYALMDPGIPVDDEDDSESSEEMEAMYDAMDAELKATAASRAKEVGAQEEIADENVAVDAHVLSNLMQSLGASEGAPGPVENMLKEMGIHPPKLRSDDMDGDEVER